MHLPKFPAYIISTAFSLTEKISNNVVSILPVYKTSKCSEGIVWRAKQFLFQKVTVNMGEHCLALSRVALSRVRKLSTSICELEDLIVSVCSDDTTGWAFIFINDVCSCSTNN